VADGLAERRLDPAMAQRADEAKLIVDGRVPLEWMTAFGARTRMFLQPEGNNRPTSRWPSQRQGTIPTGCGCRCKRTSSSDCGERPDRLRRRS